MKHNQYFAALYGDDNILVIGKAVLNDETFYLLTNNSGLEWDASKYSPSVLTKGFDYFVQVGDPEDDIQLWESNSIFGYTPISKARYEELSNSKKLRTSLDKELNNRYFLGSIANYQVRRIEDLYVFGCGALSLTKKEMEVVTDRIEDFLKKNQRREEIEGEILNLQAERDKLDDSSSTKWSNIDQLAKGQLSSNGVYEDDFDFNEIKNIRKILQK